MWTCTIAAAQNQYMRRLSAEQAAYLAGLVDADGTVTLSRRHKNEHRHPVVSICNTDRNLLEYCLKLTGVGKITRKAASSNKHSVRYTYAAYNRQALALMDSLQPFLTTYKAKRAAFILDRYLSVTPRNGKYTQDQAAKKEAFEKSLLAIKPNRTGRQKTA